MRTTVTPLRLRSTRSEGRLDLSRLDDVVPDWRERQTWACGPEGMLNAAERVWSAAGIEERLHLERFAVSKTAVHGQGGTVEFARSGKTVTVDAATPLMDAGEQVGHPHAVRVPDGHLPVVRRRSARRARPGPAHGRRKGAGQPGADVHFRSFGRLRAGRLDFTDW